MSSGFDFGMNNEPDPGYCIDAEVLEEEKRLNEAEGVEWVSPVKPSISQRVLIENGVEETQYTLTLKNGMSVVLSSFGATIVKVILPDRDGEYADCVLGFDTRAEYDRDMQFNPYFGATIGRVANRIRDSKFTIDGVETQLDANEAPNHLHGGL